MSNPLSPEKEKNQIKIKDYKHLTLLTLGTIVTLAAYWWFIKTPYFEIFKDWSQQNFKTYFTVLVSLKAIGLVWPPLPGGVLTIGSIPVLGWLNAYLADLLGSIFGASAAYFIARRWGYQFIKKIFDEATIERIKKIKIKKHREIEAIFFLRIFGGTIVEAVCYGAGLLNIKYLNFAIGTIASHVVLGVPFYYFTNNIFEGKNFIFNLIIVAIFIPWALVAKKRYLEEPPHSGAEGLLS